MLMSVNVRLYLYITVHAGVHNIAQNSSDNRPYDHLTVANADGDTITLSLLSVCLSITTVNHAEMAEPIEMPFGMWTWVSSRNYVLDPDGKEHF